MDHTNRSLAPVRALQDLVELTPEVHRLRGYEHTLREICQQPELWRHTAHQVAGFVPEWKKFSAGARAIVLTGSGSSHYVGSCIELALQQALRTPVQALVSGELLVLGPESLSPVRPLLMVSFARSGDSPESRGLIQRLLAEDPDIRHLVITCNASGWMARAWGPGRAHDPRVRLLTLDQRTCDRSLVMTSSFTNLAIAGLGLCFTGESTARYTEAVEKLAEAVGDFLSSRTAELAEAAADDFQRLIVLGNGPLHGAGREAALKMLEMTDGRVMTMAETCLGFRHGPMCALHRDTLLFVVLSTDPVRRAYQVDLLQEIDAKRLGRRKIVAGAHVPAEVLRPGDIAIEWPQLAELGDEWVAIAGVVAGQLLGFFRCLSEGLCPDQPAVGGTINRVVGDFTLHGVANGTG